MGVRSRILEDRSRTGLDILTGLLKACDLSPRPASGTKYEVSVRVQDCILRGLEVAEYDRNVTNSVIFGPFRLIVP